MTPFEQAVLIRAGRIGGRMPEAVERSAALKDVLYAAKTGAVPISATPDGHVHVGGCDLAIMAEAVTCADPLALRLDVAALVMGARHG
jgi:enoyl-CoA hydratase/carnithine racemase